MAAPLTIIPHKRGDSFVVDGVLEDEATGMAVDLAAFTITSQVRSAAGTAFDLEVVKSGERGAYRVSASPEITASWPTGPLSWDIQYAVAGQVHSTETYRILVQEDCTR